MRDRFPFGRHQWVVSGTRFNGCRRVSIWPHFLNCDGNWQPGKAGLQIDRADVDELIEAIRAAAATLD